MWAYCTRKTARVTAKRGTTAAYSWNDRLITFHFCLTCGCLTHYAGTARHDPNTIAVNARMMDPKDIAGARIRTFDGADTWKYLD